MLKQLRRLFNGSTKAAAPAVLQRWAEQHGHNFQRARHDSGCVIQGRQGTQPWRIEWGTAQRDYIGSHELRMIAEIGLPGELLVLVLNHQLLEAMEKAVYDQFVDDVQTRIDTDTPAEMRWLVLYPQLNPTELGRLRERYGAVSSVKPWLVQWLDSPLNDALMAAVPATNPDLPMVMTIQRGRLTLRTAMPQPDEALLGIWFAVFEHALREARRVGTDWRDAVAAGLTTQPSAFSNSLLSPTDLPADAAGDLSGPSTRR